MPTFQWPDWRTKNAADFLTHFSTEIVRGEDGNVVLGPDGMPLRGERKLPSKLSYAIADTLENMSVILQKAEKRRQGLLRDYCQKNEDGSLKIKPNSREVVFLDDAAELAYKQELEILMGTEHGVEVHQVPKVYVRDTMDNFGGMERSWWKLLDFMWDDYKEEPPSPEE